MAPYVKMPHVVGQRLTCWPRLSNGCGLQSSRGSVQVIAESSPAGKDLMIRLIVNLRIRISR